jgi:hypothetical protein
VKPRKTFGKEITAMALKLARFVNLLLAALLADNEFGTLVAVHPALGERNSR